MVCLICYRKIPQGSIHHHLQAHNLTVSQYRKKFNIPSQSTHGRGGPFGCTPHNKKYANKFTRVPCHICKRIFQVATDWYHLRLRKGKNRFACSRKCTNKLQSLTIKEVRSTDESRAKTIRQLKRRWSDPAERRHYGAIMKSKPPEWHRHRIANSLKFKLPTKPERIFMDIIKRDRLPFRYVGNGKLWIGKLNPDFVSTDGSKRLVEVFGCFWHNCKRCFPNSKFKIIPLKQRLTTFKKHGYTTKIVWEHELKPLSA